MKVHKYYILEIYDILYDISLKFIDTFDSWSSNKKESTYVKLKFTGGFFYTSLRTLYMVKFGLKVIYNNISETYNEIRPFF